MAWADDPTPVTANTTMGISAVVTKNCVISTTPIAFGNIDVTAPAGSQTDGNGTILVTCTSGAGYTLTADAGQGGPDATILIRQMTSGTDKLNYALYTDNTYGTTWGDGTTGSSITGTGTGVEVPTTIYGRVLPGQSSAPAGSYADTVAVTLTY